MERLMANAKKGCAHELVGMTKYLACSMSEWSEGK